MIPIVLASASPRRKALLEALGIPIEVRVSQIDETAAGAPHDIVLHNARAKRDAIAAGLAEEAIIIGADTIVVLNDHIMGKPRDLQDAREMLGQLSGQTHSVHTGLALVDTASGHTAEGVETTAVTFRELSSPQIERFVDAVNPIDRAGAYTVDGPGSLLVERYTGCYQNVLGLPIVRLDKLFRQLGQDLAARMDPGRAQFL